MTIKIRIARRSDDDLPEPYAWYDAQGEGGWVLRYSLSVRLGERHLDETVGMPEDEDATDEEIREGSLVALRWAGAMPPRIQEALR